MISNKYVGYRHLSSNFKILNIKKYILVIYMKLERTDFYTNFQEKYFDFKMCCLFNE